jgi:hypothetical protein
MHVSTSSSGLACPDPLTVQSIGTTTSLSGCLAGWKRTAELVLAATRWPRTAQPWSRWPAAYGVGGRTFRKNAREA